MIRLALLPAIFFVFLLPAHAQMKDVYAPGIPPPPPPLDPDHDKTVADRPKLPQHHVDLVKLQQEADDLARTAQSIPSDITSVRRGALPKDTIQKLKQIEKLSKRLRSELNP